MELVTVLRLNMSNRPDAADHAERYRAALEMAAFADTHGFTSINCEEHHLARSAWLPSPLLMASAVAAVTERVRITISALLITLYDPVRLAEDIAVLDNLSGGRFSFVAGLGYREEEYRATGRDWHRRGRAMDECLELMLAAWGSSEPAERDGLLIDVTPKPHTKPHPFFLIGGMSAAAARRAARFGLPFAPPMAMPELEQLYLDELRRLGNTGFVFRPERGNTTTFLHDDPPAAERAYRPYLRGEIEEYRSWKAPGVARPNEDEDEPGAAYEIITPEQCVADIRGGRREVVLHPLVGGLPLAEGWRTLRLFADRVLPAIPAG